MHALTLQNWHPSLVCTSLHATTLLSAMIDVNNTLEDAHFAHNLTQEMN